MTYIPDPVELLEARMERLAQEWKTTQVDVPAGLYRCPYCRRLFAYEPIALDARPDSPAMCYDCLPDDVKAAYDSAFD